MKEIFQTLKQEIKQNPFEILNVTLAMTGVIGFLWVVLYIANQFNLI